MGPKDNIAVKAMKATGLSKYALAQVCNAAGIPLATEACLLAFKNSDGIAILVTAGVVGYHALCVPYNIKGSILDDPKRFQDTLNRLKEDNPGRSMLEMKAELQEYADLLSMQDKKDAVNGKLVALCGLAAGVAAGAAYSFLPDEMKEARDILGYAMLLGPSMFCAGLANLFRGVPYNRR